MISLDCITLEHAPYKGNKQDDTLETFEINIDIMYQGNQSLYI